MNQNRSRTRGARALRALRRRVAQDALENRRLRIAAERFVEIDGRIQVVARLREQLEAAEGYLRALAERLEQDLRVAPEAGVTRPEEARQLARDRRWRRWWFDNLPARCFESLPVEDEARDAAYVARMERRPVASDYAGALRHLPAPWMWVAGGWHLVRRRPSVLRMIHVQRRVLVDPVELRKILDGGLKPADFRLLARLVLAGAWRPDDIAREGDDFRVARDWRPAPSSPGAWLRHLGLAFVGTEDGLRTVYLPADARREIAVALVTCLESRDTEPELVARLRSLLAGLLSDSAPGFDPTRGGVRLPPGLPSPRAWGRRKTPGPDRVVDLDVVLEGVRPRVRRVIRISSQRPLGALHETLQLAMGWASAMAHRFERGASRWSERGMVWTPRGARDEWATPIRDVLGTVGAGVRYVYGCGCCASWVLNVQVCAVHAPEGVAAEPAIVWADRAAPPADWGGPNAYREYLRALEDPECPDRQAILAKCSGPFDPDFVDPGPANERLRAVE